MQLVVKTHGIRWQKLARFVSILRTLQMRHAVKILGIRSQNRVQFAQIRPTRWMQLAV